ncbi:MAG TPA: hypothetical protein VMT20_03050, partial [Terriglobia bacterium]|nr:hypothetical protein [Terriglobia bacterium]
ALRTEMRGLRMETLETRETADLLGESFGIRLPEGIATALARMPGLQEAMASVFPLAMAGAFIGVVAEAIDKLVKMRDEAEGIGKVWDDYLQKSYEHHLSHEDTIEKQKAGLSQLRSIMEDLIGLGSLRQKASETTGHTLEEQDKTIQHIHQLEETLKALGIDSTNLASEKVKISEALTEGAQRLVDLEKKKTEEDKKSADEAARGARERAKEAKEAERIAEAFAKTKAVFPTLAATELERALQQIAKETETQQFKQLIGLLTGNLEEAGFKMGAAPKIDPFGTMAQSMNAAIIPLTNFTKQFQVLASLQPQLFTEQQRIIMSLKIMAQEWTQNAVPMMQFIKQFGLADVAASQFTQTAQRGFNQVGQALAQAAANSLVFGSNFGKAMEQAVKSTAASIAAEAVLWVLKCTALGFYYLAIQDYKDATLAFEAAGIWAAIGGAAAGAGAALGGGGGAGGSGGGGAGGGVSRGTPVATSGTPRGLGGYAGNNQTNVQINLNGPMTPQVWKMVAPDIISAVNSAVSNGSASLLATTTTRAPNRTAGR